jgi:hypothetical protein
MPSEWFKASHSGNFRRRNVLAILFPEFEEQRSKSR